MKSIKAYLLPIITACISVLILVVVVKPLLTKLTSAKQQLADLKQSEARVNDLMQVYDKLRNTYQQISEKDKQVLEKALPSNINNVRLILELERIAELRGLGFKDVEVQLKENKDDQPANAVKSQLKKVEASITLVGSYPDFIKYLTDLEKSLRILTIRSVDFTATRQDGKPTQFEYDLEIETYWFVDNSADTATDSSSSTGKV